MPPLTTAGCDKATATSMRELLGNTAMEVKVNRRQVDQFFQEW